MIATVVFLNRLPGYYNKVSYQNRKMISSLVDYVLERGKFDSADLAIKGRETTDQSSPLYNHRRLLAYLFQAEQGVNPQADNRVERRISELKLEEISGQLNYFSEKIHAEFSKKQLTLDGDLYRLQNEWLRKKMPDFYSYFYLKFAYANSYTKMHELFLAEIQNMGKEKDSYLVIKKTIEARESCLLNLRKQIHLMKELDVEESLNIIKEERELRRKHKLVKQHGEHPRREKEKEEGGKSWKNELEVLFENINHMRKLTCYVAELIRMWKQSIYNLSEDPRRFRERVIFYHNDANYLLKMLFDSNFLRDSFLKKYLNFSKKYDPFLLKPAMLLDSKKTRTQTDDIFLELIKPNEMDMNKITKALIVMAEEEYDEDQQSKFISQRKNYGELEQRKQLLQQKRDSLGLKKMQSQKILPEKPFSSIESRVQKKDSKMVGFSNDKKLGNTQKEVQPIKYEKDELNKQSRVQTSLNRLKQMRSIDLKKVSPYLSRNDRIQKAQKVIQLQHKFRVAQSEYVETLKKKKEDEMKQKVKSSIDVNKETINSKIFNRYIEQNLKMMDQASKKAYLYKTQNLPEQKRLASSLGISKIRVQSRKAADYDKNIEKLYPTNDPSPSPVKGQKNMKAPGTKAIIQISNRGVKSNEKIIQYELTNRKGKNVGEILSKREKSMDKDLTKSKYEERPGQEAKQGNQTQPMNLFDSEKQSEVLIIRQQPEKLEEIKQFLYEKIKQELMEQMKRDVQNKEIELNNMIQQEKRRKQQEIREAKRLQEERRRQEQQRQRIAKLQREKKKLSFDILIQPVQYAEENVGDYFDQIFSISSEIYQKLFTTQQIDVLKQQTTQQFYYFFLKGLYQNKDMGLSILHFDWQHELHRKMVIDYVATKDSFLFISYFHRIVQFLWKNDPCQQIEIIMYKNEENLQGLQVFDDVYSYADRHGQIFEKQLDSKITEMKFIWKRPSHYCHVELPFKNYYFGKLLHFKTELLFSSISFTEIQAPKIDNDQQFLTNYIFFLEQLFRLYLTPEQIVDLRENATNIRRLKDIFRIILELEKNNPVVEQLMVLQGSNLNDLYIKVKDKKMGPYDRYQWHHFSDKVRNNRLLLSIMELKPEIQYNVQSCIYMDRHFLRINCRQKITILRSSVYSEKDIFILETSNPKIKIFLTDGQHYKLMRMQLFIFLNLVFNNIIEDQQQYVSTIWIPQFAVCDGSKGKGVKKITDFSITMKKSLFLSEEIYFCNNEYIKHGVSVLPKQPDVVFPESIIFGFMHTEVQKSSAGMPIYAKLIDEGEIFY